MLGKSVGWVAAMLAFCLLLGCSSDSSNDGGQTHGDASTGSDATDGASDFHPDAPIDSGGGPSDDARPPRDSGADGTRLRDGRAPEGGDGEAGMSDPCIGGPELPDESGPMKIVIHAEGFAGLPFSLAGVYDQPAGSPDVCGAASTDAASASVFDVVRSNDIGVLVHTRWSNSPSNTDVYPPVRDGYTERDYMIIELETMIRIDDEILNLKFGAGGGGDAGLYAGSRLEGRVDADLEETGRLDAHFRVHNMAYTVPSGDGGVTVKTTSELLCIWVVGNCQEPLQ